MFFDSIRLSPGAKDNQKPRIKQHFWTEIAPRNPLFFLSKKWARVHWGLEKVEKMWSFILVFLPLFSITHAIPRQQRRWQWWNPWHKTGLTTQKEGNLFLWPEEMWWLWGKSPLLFPHSPLPVLGNRDRHKTIEVYERVPVSN